MEIVDNIFKINFWVVLDFKWVEFVKNLGFVFILIGICVYLLILVFLLYVIVVVVVFIVVVYFKLLII